MVKILGIDEAGRGPVIGPLVIVGFELEESEVEILRELGVRDSKKLSREERKRIFEEIQKLGKYYVEMVPPGEIDISNINSIEIRRMKKIIVNSRASKVYIDAFSKKLEEFLAVPGIKIIAEHKADEKYPIVSAASIIAKVIRDAEIEKIKEEFGDFGSGYPSDERTVRFLKEYYKKYRRFPPFVRKSWSTIHEITAGKQLGLTDFL